jgi:hypothetical protein
MERDMLKFIVLLGLIALIFIILSAMTLYLYNIGVIDSHEPLNVAVYP